MIPLRDNIRTQTFPIITVSIIGVNTVIFLWQRFFVSGVESEALYRTYGLVPRELLISFKARYDLLPFNVLTIFTSMFLHGGFFHIIGNMLYLWIFGNNIEDAVGHGRFVLFYLLSGLVAALFQFFSDPASAVPMIGASGAVAGILGAYLVLYPHARVSTLFFIIIIVKVIEIPAVLLLTLWFFIQLLYSQSDGVAWYAHIGGFIFGLVTIRLFRKNVRRRPRTVVRAS